VPACWYQRERELEPASGLCCRGEPLGSEADLVDLSRRVVVFDRAADRAGPSYTDDRGCGVARLAPVPVLEIDGDRQGRCRDERPGVLDDLVERGAAVTAAESEGEAGARRGERLEAEPLEHLGGAGIPGIRDDERLALVERTKVCALLRLARH
jgi:hypothetical protein